MSETDLFIEIIKTLDYSNTSKERIQQLILAQDNRVLTPLRSFLRERESSSLPEQNEQALKNLKRDLDIILFGKTTFELTQKSQTFVSSSPIPTYPSYGQSNIASSSITTTFNGVGQRPLSQQGSQATFGTSTFTSGQYSSQPTTPVRPLQFTSSTSGLQNFQFDQNYNTSNQAPQINYGTTLNNPDDQVKRAHNDNNDDYYKKLLEGSQIQQSVQGNQNNQDNKLAGKKIVKPEYNEDDEEQERAVKKGRAKHMSEYQLDNRVQKIRETKKAKKDQELVIDINEVKKELERFQIFQSKYVRGQPLAPELYKLFYDAVDELDYPRFLALSDNLFLDEMNLEMDANSIVKINPLQFLTFAKAEQLKLKDIFYLLMIFFYLDYNNNGIVDSDDIQIGFVMLANTSEKEKLEAAFYVIDKDKSGTLTLDEVQRYMRSIIRLGDGRKFHSNDSFEHENLIEKIAQASAERIFKEMDLNLDSEVSYQEFILWHNLNLDGQDTLDEEKINAKKLIDVAKKLKEDKLMKYNAFTLGNNDYKQITTNRLLSVQKQKIDEKTIQTFRTSLNLENINFLEAVKFLKSYKVSERLGFPTFLGFMKDLYNHCHIEVDMEAKKKAINDFYNSVDLDSNGLIEWNELLGAFSLLCVGTKREKINGIIEVFDTNDDKVLQFNEVYNLFFSSFNLIFLRNPESDIARQDPKQLAFCMALTAFSDNELDPYVNGIDQDTFANWYRNFDVF